MYYSSGPVGVNPPKQPQEHQEHAWSVPGWVSGRRARTQGMHCMLSACPANLRSAWPQSCRFNKAQLTHLLQATAAAGAPGAVWNRSSWSCLEHQQLVAKGREEQAQGKEERGTTAGDPPIPLTRSNHACTCQRPAKINLNGPPSEPSTTAPEYNFAASLLSTLIPAALL